MASDSSGRAQASTWKVADLDPESIGREAIHKAELGRNPRDVEPGNYPVILDPYVTDDLLDMLNMYGMGGQTVLDGRSWMNDRIGDQVMSPQVNIWDDGLDPRRHANAIRCGRCSKTKSGYRLPGGGHKSGL